MDGLPFKAVKHLVNLQLSPLGVVIQHERRPHTIVDYTYSGINQSTVPFAPWEAMQFGHYLNHLLQQLAEVDSRHRPVYIIKLDIADGFY